MEIDGRKGNKREAIKYYKKNTDLPRNLIHSYVGLISDPQRYERKDTLKANKIINQLFQYNDNTFYRLMRVRLEWEFKQRLKPSLLDSARLLLKNNIDLAYYYYMLGNYFKDSMSERMARKFGFVRVTLDGNEIPDWRKIESFRLNFPGILISLHEYHMPSDDNRAEKNMMDSSIYYYKKAIDFAKTEFYYIKELLFLLNKHYQEATLQQIIKQYQNNYTSKEKKWLTALFAESITRQKKIIK